MRDADRQPEDRGDGAGEVERVADLAPRRSTTAANATTPST